MSDLDSQQMQEMFQTVFGRHPFCMLVFSASLQDAFLQDALSPERQITATETMRGLAVEQQVRAAAGLHPVLGVVFETAVPENISHVDCPAFHGGLRASCTFRLDFFSPDTLTQWLRRLRNGLTTKHSREGRITRMPMDGGSQAAYWPLLRGDKPVVLYVGGQPLPDTRPQA